MPKWQKTKNIYIFPILYHLWTAYIRFCILLNHTQSICVGKFYILWASPLQRWTIHSYCFINEGNVKRNLSNINGKQKRIIQLYEEPQRIKNGHYRSRIGNNVKETYLNQSNLPLAIVSSSIPLPWIIYFFTCNKQMFLRERALISS